MRSELSTVFIALLLVQVTTSARIFIILTAPSLSHHLFYQPIIQELSLRGHQVVSVSPHPINDSNLTNLTEIDIHDVAYGALSVAQWLEESQSEPETQMAKIKKFHPTFIRMNDRILDSSKVKQLITNADKEHFDLVIIEMLSNGHLLAFKELYNCPAIGIVSMEPNMDSLDAIGNPPDPNYNGAMLEKSGRNLDFWERLNLVWHNFEYRIFYHYTYEPLLNGLVNKHFRTVKTDVGKLQSSIDLIMINTNPIFHIPKPHVPACIEIGGLHERKRKPLPNDLKTYLDNSPQGVVYFSLGSNVRSENLHPQTRQMILDAFKQLPYNVIWKWESDTLVGKPSNVLLKKWLPQQDVLDHPNVVTFVTQGGLQSIEEAISSRVPMLGIPFGGDQESNVQKIEELGIGKWLELKEITTELLVKSIWEIASDKKYKENIHKIASQIWDQETKPLDRAIWWIEYVIRHKGAKHLRSPAADLPWHKYLLLDIIGFILGVLILIVAVVIYLVKIVLKFISFGKSKYKKE